MAPWTFKGIGFFPLIVGILISAGFILVYIIAVVNRHVTPYMPFVSEAGTTPPEGGIFSILLYLGSATGLLTMILRFMIVSEFNQSVDQCLDRVNIITFVVGIVAMLGMIVVAAYPMSTVFRAHMIGATTVFVGGFLYTTCQTWITYRMNPYYNGLTICRIRLALTMVSCVVALNMIIFSPIARFVWTSASHEHWSGSKQPGDKGFDVMVVSATVEWTMVFLFAFYFFTLVREYQTVTLEVNIQIVPPKETEGQLPDAGRPRPTMRSSLL